MSTLIDELKNAINEGDLDKVVKIVFSLTKEGKEILILGKPLFARIKESKAEVKPLFKKEKTEVETIEIYLYYPVWVLMLVIERNLANNDISISYDVRVPENLGGRLIKSWFEYQPMERIK